MPCPLPIPLPDHQLPFPSHRLRRQNLVFLFFTLHRPTFSASASAPALSLIPFRYLLLSAPALFLLAPSGTRSIRRDTRNPPAPSPSILRRPNGRKRHQRRPPSFSLSHDSPASYSQLLYSVPAATVPLARYPSTGLHRASHRSLVTQPYSALSAAVSRPFSCYSFCALFHPTLQHRKGRQSTPTGRASTLLRRTPSPALPDAADKGDLPSAR